MEDGNVCTVDDDNDDEKSMNWFILTVTDVVLVSFITGSNFIIGRSTIKCVFSFKHQDFMQ